MKPDRVAFENSPSISCSSLTPSFLAYQWNYGRWNNNLILYRWLLWCTEVTKTLLCFIGVVHLLASGITDWRRSKNYSAINVYCAAKGVERRRDQEKGEAWSTKNLSTLLRSKSCRGFPISGGQDTSAPESRHRFRLWLVSGGYLDPVFRQGSSQEASVHLPF